MSDELPLNPEDFAAYYSFAPAALALRECVRLGAVRKLDLAEPILDVGCGDGLFARLAYPDKQTWGIDINVDEVQRAQATASYSTLICGNICGVSLPQSFFGSAIANCSLEHVPDINGALRNIRGSLKPGAEFVLIVPTPDWTKHLATAEMLRRVGMVGLARAYGDGLDKVFSHVHLYPEDKWCELLEDAGFEQVKCTTIVNHAASWAFDLLLYPSVLGYITKRFTGRWVMLPGFRMLSVDLARYVTNAMGRMAPDSEVGGEYMLRCRVPDSATD